MTNTCLALFFNELDLPTPDYHFEALVCDRHQMQVGRMDQADSSGEICWRNWSTVHVVVVKRIRNTTFSWCLGTRAKLEIPGLSHIDGTGKTFV